jgi:hypothetical protein
MTATHAEHCPYPVSDRRRGRWTPGMVTGTTRKSCPWCGVPWSPPRPRCTALVKVPFTRDHRCRLPVHRDGLCIVHARLVRRPA